MAYEKTTTLNLDKIPFSEKEKKKSCSKAVVSCVLGVLLTAILVVLTIEFLYPEVDTKCFTCTDHTIINDNKDDNEMKDFLPDVATHSSSVDERKIVKKYSWDSKFLIDPSELCATRNPPESEEYKNEPEVKLLVLVTSAANHFVKRSAIRNTWGSMAKNPLGPMRLGFVLGTTKDETEENLIHEESSFYNDIIQADFEDTSEYLTTKSVVMLKWMAKRCPHAQYFLKAEDDTYVNVNTLATILGSEPFVSELRFIGGYVQNKTIPEQADEYSDYGQDSYTSGSAYVMPGLTAVDLSALLQDLELDEDFSPLAENVFITGICGKYVDAPLLHDPRFRFEDLANPPSWDAFSSLATAHSVTPDDIQKVWEEMTRSILDPLFHHELALNTTVLLRKRFNQY